MRIGFDVSDLATGRADGTTRYTSELAKRLPVLGQEHEWHYFAPFDSPAIRRLAQGKPDLRVHISSWPRYWTQLRLPWDLYRFRPDVLFMPIQQLPLLRPGNMKTVAVIHDLAIHYYPEQFTYKDWLLLHVFSAQAAREADHLICVSRATANDVSKFYGRTEGVHVIHHGLDHEQFRVPTVTEWSASRLALEEKYAQLKQPYVLFVGQLQPRKNLMRLVEAFEKLVSSASSPALQLVIAGSHGWLNEPIKRRVATSKYTARIHMLGRLPDEMLTVLYWHAEVFVLPSLYEGFGLPLLEAMACGCPVVTSNISSMPEVVGQAAILIDPLSTDDIVRGITEAQQRREELKAAGVARAAEFSWDATAQQTLKVLTGADRL
ncbi:MAG TPA: glycosyltransferase family 1 protein [Candidatus Andersenbacteria bacterium]|nr:MAG: hypothetical protein A2854_01825 [Parcubacteria group bacterium RIFCSPHIGHO2_01_FULL_56_18]HLD25894.1 glycosyltransferase family 1 protein [Candidatus Andersenbacteria bacterium]